MENYLYHRKFYSLMRDRAGNTTVSGPYGILRIPPDTQDYQHTIHLRYALGLLPVNGPFKEEIPASQGLNELASRVTKLMAAVGGATMVWVDLKTGKSSPWPDHVINKLR